MGIYEQDISGLLAEHEVVLVEEAGRYYLDAQSLRNLEAYIGVLRVQTETLKKMILVIGADAPKHRLSTKELRIARQSLERRAKHLYKKTTAAMSSGVPKTQTSYDREELVGLGIALPLLDAAYTKAVRDNEEMPGGTSLARAEAAASGEDKG